jgi:hypothetical protein
VSYVSLGRKKTVAAADATGLNTGNWTNVFDHSILKANVAAFECYHMSVINVPHAIVLTVYVGVDVFSSVLLAANAEWDPAQALPLTPDDDVYLCWSATAAGTPPTAWMWLRYDPAVQPIPLGGA